MPTKEKLTKLVSEYLNKNKSDSDKIKPSITIVENAEMWKRIGVLFLVVSKSPDSGLFTMAYNDNKVAGFEENFLLSQVYLNDCFYYSYHFSSGIPTLLIGYIRRVNGEIEHMENFGFQDGDNNDISMNSYLYKKDGKVYSSFNNTTLVKIKESGEIVLVKNDGTEIRSKGYREKQQTQPKGK